MIGIRHWPKLTHDKEPYRIMLIKVQAATVGVSANAKRRKESNLP